MAIGDTVVGTVATGGPQGESSTRLGREISDIITFKGANIAPLTRLCNLNKKSVRKQEFNILEDGDRPLTIATNGGTLTAGTTTITLTDGTRGRAYDIYMNEGTGEQILLTEAGGATTWANVIRNYGTTAAAAFADGSNWRWIGNAVDEPGAAITSLQTAVQTRTNYCQFFIERTELTEITKNTIHEGNMDEQERQRKNTRRSFLRGMESAFIWGEPLAEEQGQSPVWSGVNDTLYKTGGFIYWTSGNSRLYAQGGNLSFFDFMDIVGDCTLDSPENMGNDEVQLFAYCGQKAAAALNTFSLGNVRTKVGDKKYGVNLNSIDTPFGKIAIMQHHLLTGSAYEGHILLVNPKYVGYRYLQGMDITLNTMIQNPETPHVFKDEISAVCGFYLTQPSFHATITGVEAAV